MNLWRLCSNVPVPEGVCFWENLPVSQGVTYMPHTAGREALAPGSLHTQQGYTLSRLSGISVTPANLCRAIHLRGRLL